MRLIVFRPLKMKNMGMPARHISSQSFDEILSELGDDPAIPDPHGIRKQPPQKTVPPRPPSQTQQHPFAESFPKPQIPISLQKLGGLIGLLFGVLAAAALAFFVAYNALIKEVQIAQEEPLKQISELKKEIALTRDEIHQDQDELFLTIEEIEVSIHSLKERKPEKRVFSKPQAPSHETELRRWRYLGAAQMGNTHQAFFNTGKNNIAFEKGAQVLGDWRLSNIENGMAIFTHPQGKSLVLKAYSSE